MTTYRSTSSGSFTGTTGATGVATTLPSGATTGDVVYLAVSFSANSTVVQTVTATGWDPVTTNPIAAPSNSAVILRRALQAGDTAPTFNWAAAGTSSGAWMMMALDEADNTTPEAGVTPVEATGAASTSHVAGSISAANNDDFLMAFAFGDNPGAGIVGDYTAVTAGMTLVDATAGTNAAFVGAAYQQLSSSGATGAKTFTGNSAAWAAVSLVVKNAITQKVGSDSGTLSGESAALSQSRTDSATLSEAVSISAPGFTGTDSAVFTEVSTQTDVDDNLDGATLTEQPVTLTVQVTSADSATLFDSIQDSPSTGLTAVAQGSPLDETYFILPDATATQFTVGTKVLFFNTGSIKEPTLFTVTAVSEPAFGFRNVSFTPRALETVEAGDDIRAVHGATGAQITSNFPVTDAFSFADVSNQGAPLERVDSATLAESVALREFYAMLDSGILGESADLREFYGAVDAAALADSSSLARSSAGTDTGSLSESASVVAVLAGSDDAALNDSAIPAFGLAASDAAALAEAPEGTAALTGTPDPFIFTDVSALNTGSDQSTFDGFTFSEASSLSGVASPEGSDAATLGESALVTAQIDSSDSAELTESMVYSAVIAANDVSQLLEGLAAVGEVLFLVGSDSLVLAGEVSSLATEDVSEQTFDRIGVRWPNLIPEVDIW